MNRLVQSATVSSVMIGGQVVCFGNMPGNQGQDSSGYTPSFWAWTALFGLFLLCEARRLSHK